MNDQNHTPQDDELEGFDTFEDEDAIDAQALADEAIDDADFQDISDDVDADVFGETEPAPPAKKKTSWFNIGIAVVALVVAGGLIFMKLGPSLMGGGDETQINAPAANNNAAPSNDTGANNAQQAAQAALAPDGNAKAAAAKNAGLLDSPDQYANLGNMPSPDNAAKAAPAAPSSDPFAGVPNTPANVPAPVTAAVPMPTPISAAPIAPVPATETKTTTTVTSVPLPAPAVAVAAADNSALADKVNTLETRLNDIDTKLANIKAPADDGRLNTIQTTLERLESRLDDMASRKTPVREVAASAPSPSMEPAPVRTRTVTAKAKSKKARSNSSDTAYNPARAIPVSTGSGGWQLRGATPGRATVARGSDIREVGVGENVPGLGEITGVAQIKGQWVVQGTQGRLAQ